MKLKTMIPMLAVKDIARSIDFYEQALDFIIVSDPAKVQDWNWAILRQKDSNPAIEIMLAGTEGGPAFPDDAHYFATIFYFYPDDVRALYEKLKSAGYAVTELKETFYGMTEFSLRDPDQHLLSFGQDLHEE